MNTTPLQKIDTLFELQYHHRQKCRDTTVKQRITWLKALQAAILAHRTAIQEALHLDLRKHPIESDYTEIFPVISEIKLFCKHLSKWCKARKRPNNLVFLGAEAYTILEPKGNCLIITPWNYPFQLPLLHLIACIAAGNTAIIKPSEFTPHTNKVLSGIIEKVFEKQHVTLIEGTQATTTYLLHKKWDHIHFTGSPKVGKIIMEAAARHLSSVTLELGGKSPCIIDKGIRNMEEAVRKITWGKLVNPGQTCIAPDYVLLHESDKERFVTLFKQYITDNFGNAPGQSPDLARIINDNNYNRLLNLLSDALQRGACLETGGNGIAEQRFIEPTLLSAVPAGSLIEEEEIFGPILPIITYTDNTSVIQYINGKEKPLAMYVFSDDKRLLNVLQQNTSSGVILQNDVMLHIMHPNLPFGGIKHSGTGQSTGYFGLKDFSHEKPVLISSRLFSASRLLRFPYNNKIRKLINIMLKYF